MKKNTAPKGIKIKMSREEIAYQIFIAVVVGLSGTLLPDSLPVCGRHVLHIRGRDDPAEFLRYHSAEADFSRL